LYIIKLIFNYNYHLRKYYLTLNVYFPMACFSLASLAYGSVAVATIAAVVVATIAAVVVATIAAVAVATIAAVAVATIAAVASRAPGGAAGGATGAAATRTAAGGAGANDALELTAEEKKWMASSGLIAQAEGAGANDALELTAEEKEWIALSDLIARAEGEDLRNYVAFMKHHDACDLAAALEASWDEYLKNKGEMVAMGLAKWDNKCEVHEYRAFQSRSQEYQNYLSQQASEKPVVEVDFEFVE